MDTRVAGDDLTSGGVAAILRVHASTVTRIPRERLPFDLTPGGHRRYRREDVDRYVTELRRGPQEPRSSH